MRSFSNVIGIDDAPFDRAHRGDVAFVGTVYAGPRLDGVLVGKVRRDGVNATDRIAERVLSSAFSEHAQVVLLDGIALGGFNVVDLDVLHARLARPVLVISRNLPDLAAIHRALMGRVPGGAAKWERIVRAGPMEAASGVFVQRRGLSLDEAVATIELHRLQGKLPEPLRVAHLIAGALIRGESHGGA